MTRLDELVVTADGPDRLGASGSMTGDQIELVLTGTAEVVDRPGLGDLLDRVHTLARSKSVRQVRVDMQGLKFMTSSCFKDFVTWLSRINGSDPAARYLVHFRSNPTIRWQRTGLHALASFAVDVVTIE